MRILRVRRGYTTNSSATSEWLPGSGTGTYTGTSATPQGGTQPGTSAPVAATPSATGAHVVAAGGAPPPPSPLPGNLLKVGFLTGVVVALLALERWLSLRRRRSGPPLTDQEEGGGA